MQGHGDTEIDQAHRGAEVQGLRTQGCKDIGTQGCRDTGMQRSSTQACRDTRIRDIGVLGHGNQGHRDHGHRDGSRRFGSHVAFQMKQQKSHWQLRLGDRDMSWPEQDPHGIKDCGSEQR